MDESVQQEESILNEVSNQQEDVEDGYEEEEFDDD